MLGTKKRSMICLLCMGLFFAGCGKKSVPEARLLALGGKVTIGDVVAIKGQGLSAGEILTVAPGGFARLQFPDGSKQFLFPHSKAKEALVYSLKAEKSEGEAKTMLCNLASGVMTFLVPKKRQSPVRFRIQAQHTITAIRGTEGKVTTSAKIDEVALKSGSVEVTSKSSKKTSLLKAGQRIEAGADGKIVGPFLYDFSASKEQKFYHDKLPDLKSF